MCLRLRPCGWGLNLESIKVETTRGFVPVNEKMQVTDKEGAVVEGVWHGVTLVHFSAQLEPCLTQDNTLHPLEPPNTPLPRATQTLRAPPFP